MTQRLIQIHAMTKEVVAQCSKYPEYSIGIFAITEADMRDFYKRIIKKIPSGKIEKNCQSVKNQISVRLTNGSRIDFLSNAPIGCAKRYSAVAYDEALGQRYIDSVVMKCLPIAGGRVWRLKEQ